MEAGRSVWAHVTRIENARADGYVRESPTATMNKPKPTNPPRPDHFSAPQAARAHVGPQKITRAAAVVSVAFHMPQIHQKAAERGQSDA
jgi:hypothetical protein